MGINKIDDRSVYNSIKTSENIPCTNGYLIRDRGYTEELDMWKLLMEKQKHKIMSLFHTNQFHIDKGPKYKKQNKFMKTF